MNKGLPVTWTGAWRCYTESSQDPRRRSHSNASNKSVQNCQKSKVFGELETILSQLNIWIWGSVFNPCQCWNDIPRTSPFPWGTVWLSSLSHPCLWSGRQSLKRCTGVNLRSFKLTALNFSLRANLPKPDYSMFSLTQHSMSLHLYVSFLTGRLERRTKTVQYYKYIWKRLYEK